MFTYAKTSTGWRFNGGDHLYEARKSDVLKTKWDLYRLASGQPDELVAEAYNTRDEAARDASDMDSAAIRVRLQTRQQAEALTPAATALRAEYRFQSGGSRNAIDNRRMAGLVEAALAEAVAAERTRIQAAEQGARHVLVDGVPYVNTIDLGQALKEGVR